MKYQFNVPGTIPKPGIIGRLIRLSFGVWLLYFVFEIYANREGIIKNPSGDTGIWVSLAIALYLLPHVVNIGFGRKWGRIPQYLITGMLMLCIVLSRILYQSWWAPPLDWMVIVFLIYFYSHMGLSFFLAAILRTPGCEMRSIPHLWSVLTGKQSVEHFCPGFLDKTDRWERNFFNKWLLKNKK